MGEELPRFRYHPDPVATESVELSDTACIVCGRARGFIYTGPIFWTKDEYDVICPWCIADGSAHRRFDAEFNDIESIGGDRWALVPEIIMEEVAYRTPGFHGWQQGRWWTHCGDAAEFLGRAGHKELSIQWSEAVEVMREDCDWPPGPEWDELVSEMDPNGSSTAYVFRCRHCAKLGGYWDCD